MPRVSMIDPQEHPELAPLIDRIRAERDGQLLKLYRILLNSPSLTDGWRAFFTAVRKEAKLPDRDRELAVMAVAVLTRSRYEYDQHRPHALKAGLSDEQIDAVPQWKESSVFDERERAVLAYAEAMTVDIQVPDTVAETVAGFLDARELVELTATVAGYNMVARFLEAINLTEE